MQTGAESASFHVHVTYEPRPLLKGNPRSASCAACTSIARHTPQSQGKLRGVWHARLTVYLSTENQAHKSSSS